MRPPTQSIPAIDSSFAREWKATVLERRPLILPSRHFVYPAQVEEVERGALELLVKPASGGEFLATFALGFAAPAVPTGVWSHPDPNLLCAVAGGYAYLINATDPTEWQQVEFRPVLEVTPLPQHGLLLFSGHQSLVAYGKHGKAWETGRLSWEGFQILTVGESTLTGLGWEMIADREFQFEVDLRTGAHIRLA